MDKELLNLAMENPGGAAAIIRMGLQPDVAARMDPNVGPRNWSDSFVDSTGKAVHVDGLWRVQLTDGSEIYVLVELRRARDPDVLEQILASMIRVLALQLDAGVKVDALIPVFPMLIYNGAPVWSGPLSMGNRMPAELGWFPREIPVMDLGRMPLHDLP